MIEIDKRLLIDTVTIKKTTGEKDEWGKVMLESPVTLSPVRFDRQYQVQGTQNNRKEAKPSLLFVYPQYCPAILDETFENAIVNDGKRDYRVTTVIPVSYPHNGKIFCYELECI
ncbi:minor capsid protein [Streptococcus uberis]|uniref:minor capsid protein n=1 Tax=Streptococcus uberis TaxID=1349 RepID=UPI0021502897|nr:minor capsid protein [Streptococcus uberis]MCR4258239.1 minor capsid protein [Streptococcus uberis]MCV6815287.1 minor capsid protein [Streptococcus uberis]MCZ8475554.1 minor capsid protein [Streptococcus uberis]